MRITEMDPIDRAAMVVGTGLAFTGVVVLGIVEILAGEPYGAAPVTNEAGEVVARPAVDPAIRTGLVVAGLVVLALWSVYRIASPEFGGSTATGGESAAD